MPTLQLPGVYLREIDKSDYPVRAASTVVGLVGVSSQGPLHTPTRITDEADLIRTFGKPPALSAGTNERQQVTIVGGPTGGTIQLTFLGQQTSAIAYDALAATVQTALEALPTVGSGNVTVTGNAGGPYTIEFKNTLGNRNVDPITVSDNSLTGGTSANAVVTTLVSGTTPPGDYAMQSGAVARRVGAQILFCRTCQYDASGGWLATTAKTAVPGNVGAIEFDGANDDGFQFFARTPGDWANDYQVRFTKIDGEKTTAVLEVDLDNATNGTFTLEFFGAETAAIAYDATAAEVKAALDLLSTVLDTEISVTGSDGGPYTVTFSGRYAQRAITDTELVIDGSGLTNDSSEAVTVSTAGGVVIPAHTVYRLDILGPVNDAGDIVDVIDTFDRVMLLNDNTLLETFNAYFLPTILNDGVNNVRSRSNALRVDVSDFPTTVGDIDDEIGSEAGTTYNLDSGFSALNTRGGTDGEYAAAYIGTEVDAAYGPTGLQTFGNPEEVDVNTLAIPGVTNASVLTALIALCETRSDCSCVIDTPSGLNYREATDWHNRAGEWATTGFKPNSSYAALYWRWCWIYDNYNREEILVPPSVVVPAQYAYSDAASAAWFAPAGLKRGRLSRVLRLEGSAPSRQALTSMYHDGNVINPIIDFVNEGPTIFGQRTTQRRSTSLDRVNVRRMVNYLKRVVVAATQYIPFDPHDDQTRREFRSFVEPVLKQLQNSRGLYDWRLVIDDKLNTPDVIDRGEMKAVLLIKPVKAAEFINIDLVLLSTGADFAIPGESFA